jgi:hypothetical protein
VLSDEDKRKQYDSTGFDLNDGEDNQEDKMFETESNAILQWICSCGLRTLCGGIFIVLIQYKWPVILVTIANAVAFFLAAKREGGKDFMGVCQLFLVIVIFCWLNLWSGFFTWLIELFIITWIVSSELPGGDLVSTLAAKRIPLVCAAFLAWWFGGRGWYYFYCIILEIIALLAVHIFFTGAAVLVKATVEMKIKQYGDQVKESMSALKKENRQLTDRVKQLEAKLRAKNA